MEILIGLLVASALLIYAYAKSPGDNRYHIYGGGYVDWDYGEDGPFCGVWSEDDALIRTISSEEYARLTGNYPDWHVSHVINPCR